MTKEFMFGFLMAIPCYAAILFLFRDIIIAHIFKNITAKAIPMGEPMGKEIPGDEDYKRVQDLLTEDIISDILTSYRLLLILKYEFDFLGKHMMMDKRTSKIFAEKLKYINATIDNIESMLDERGKHDEYLQIHKEVKELVTEAVKEGYVDESRDDSK